MPEFTRKQLTVIFKIAFLEAMALSIIMPTSQSSGEIPPVTLIANVGFGFPGVCQTSSTNYVSAGNGVTMTKKNHGIIIATVSFNWRSSSALPIQNWFIIYLSTTTLPDCGVSAVGSFMGNEFTDVSPPTAGLEVVVSFTATTTNPVTASTFYVYLAMRVALGSGSSMTIPRGQITVQEL